MGAEDDRTESLKGEVVVPRVESFGEPRPVHTTEPPVTINNEGQGVPPIVDVKPEAAVSH